MNRVERSEQSIRKLFGDAVFPNAATDPDLLDILSSFIFGDVYFQGNLSDKTRELINLVVFTTSQSGYEVRVHVGAALNVGASPVEIKEAIYHCAPYVGFPKSLAALAEANAVFKERKVALPAESQKKVTEEDRLEKGLEVQKSIFGGVIDQMRANAPANQKHIQDYLSAFCFGDIYTRGGLDLQTRELLTLCILITLGGCEGQVKSHLFGNRSVGNDKETLISAITQCLPYVGFPRTLNALSALNEVIPEEK